MGALEMLFVLYCIERESFILIVNNLKDLIVAVSVEKFARFMEKKC